MKKILLLLVILLRVEGFPRRFRRGDDQITYGQCKNTYEQCGEWKTQGMCTMPAYKDYMATVCPVTCEYCKDSANPVEDTTSNAVDADSSQVETSQVQQSSQVQDTTSTTSAAASEDPVLTAYQAQLKQYYENIQKQQGDYLEQTQKNAIASTSESQSAPQQIPQTSPQSYATPAEVAPATSPDSTASTQPAAASGSPSNNDITQQPAAVASQPSIPAQTSAAQVPQPSGSSAVSIATPKEAPEPDATQSSAPSGAVLPAVTPSQQAADAQLDTSPHVSSALYKNDSVSEALKQTSVNETLKSSKSNEKKEEAESEDDATNEKIQTESKHLEKTLAKVKQTRLIAAKEVKIKKMKEGMNEANNEEKDDDQEEKPNEGKKFSNSTKSENTSISKEKSKSKLTKTSLPIEKKVKKKMRSDFNIEGVSVLKHKKKLKAGQKIARSDQPIIEQVKNAFETEASLLDTTDVDAEESGSSSGSGSEGADLDNLSFLNGLNFDDDDYDVADDLSNEIANLESQKKFVKSNKEDFITSHTGHNTARSHIPASYDQKHDITMESKDVSEGDDAESATGSRKDQMDDNTQEQEGSGDMAAESESGEGSGNTQKKSITISKATILKDSSTENSNGNTENEAVGSDSTSGSGASEESEEEPAADDDEDDGDEKKNNKQKLASDFLPDDLLPASEEERKENEQKDFGSGEPTGKISFVLKQNFNDLLKNRKSANYQMLAGNIKEDIEKALKGSKMTDVSFSEATIEGNPRQVGKTKVSFNLKSDDSDVYKTLLKLVDGGNINGLSVVKASAETDDDDSD